MDVVTLRKHIMDRELDNVYVFTGDEITVQQIYVEQIGKFTEKQVKYIDSVSMIYSKTTKSFLTPMSYCYVCIDDNDFMNAEKSWDKISSIVGDNILILWCNKLDKRSKFYKYFNDIDRVVTFDRISDEWLVTYIQREMGEVSEKNCRALINACDHSYDRILLEIDKIKAYREEYIRDKQEPKPIEGILLDLLNSGVIWQESQNVVFDFIDNVVTGNISYAYELLDDCQAMSDSIVGVLTLLYNNFKMMLQVQSCKSTDIAGTTGLEDWEVKRTQKKIGAYSLTELVNALKLIRSVEVGIKQDTIAEDTALQYVLINIFR